MRPHKIRLEWKEAGAATNREPDRKCLKGYAPTLTTTYSSELWKGSLAPAHVATITPLPHNDSRRPRIKFFLQFGYRGRTGRAAGTLSTGEYKTLKGAKRRAENLHVRLLAYEMEKFLQDDA